MSKVAQTAAEKAARDHYGRLVAWLAAHCGDLERAEDAVSDALEAALRTWPEQGVPRRPESWLLTAAKRRVIDDARRAKTRRDKVDRLRLDAQEAASVPFRTGLPDRRLELLLVCAHPDVPANVRTALMLQTVLGLNADRIGSAFLVKPATMGQRLVRAKRSIAAAGIPFEVPAAEALVERAGYVLDAIYAAYGTGWEIAQDTGALGTGLAREAIWLARLVVDLLPEVAEAKGLLALMLYCESRRAARRDAAGAFVPLHEQVTELWDRQAIDEAESLVRAAASLRQHGPYQLEAAIQSLHAHRLRSGATDWQKIGQLYAVLVERFPSLGAHIGYAASLGRAGAPGQGLALLDQLPMPRVERYQPYWAVRAFLLAELGQAEGAASAYERAAGLSEDPAVRRWLLAQRRQ